MEQLFCKSIFYNIIFYFVQIRPNDCTQEQTVDAAKLCGYGQIIVPKDRPNVNTDAENCVF